MITHEFLNRSTVKELDPFLMADPFVHRNLLAAAEPAFNCLLRKWSFHDNWNHCEEFLNQGRYLLNHGYKSFLALFGMHDDVFSLEGLIVTVVCCFSALSERFVSWLSFLSLVFNLTGLECSTMMDPKLDLHLPKPRGEVNNAAWKPHKGMLRNIYNGNHINVQGFLLMPLNHF